ncbi:MAG: hypothetical protein CMH44_15345 [Muricauda sp.]|nr:hypothetical protein [Allomuricauda sp.]
MIKVMFNLGTGSGFVVGSSEEQESRTAPRNMVNIKFVFFIACFYMTSVNVQKRTRKVKIIDFI